MGDPVAAAKARSGTFKVPVELIITQRMVAVEGWAVNLLKGNEITDVLIEEPITTPSMAFRDIITLAGYMLALGMAATKCGCNVATVHLSTWRSDLGLPTRAPKNVLMLPEYRERFGHLKTGKKSADRAYIKDATMRAVKAAGYEPSDDNESDALAIFLWKQQKLQRQQDDRREDLFASTAW